MTGKYLIEQLNRLERDTNREEDFFRGDGSHELSQWMLIHNQAHRTMIHATESLVKSMGDRFDPNIVKKFVKKHMKQSKSFIRQRDKLVEQGANEDEMWNNEYTTADGIDCICHSILAIIRKQLYVPKEQKGT